MRTLGAFSALSTLTFAIGDQRDEGTQSSRSDSVRKRDELPEMLQNIANTAASEDSTCCSEERTGVERYRKDGSERMVCPAHWPSESGRFEPPTERGWLRASDPVVGQPQERRHDLLIIPHSGGSSATKTNTSKTVSTATNPASHRLTTQTLGSRPTFGQSGL